MKLTARHTFPCTADVFWQMFWDEEYDRMVSQSAGVTRETLWEREEGSDKVWRMRFTPDQELPTMVAKAVGTNKLVYEQVSRLTKENVLHWEVFPAVVPDKVTAKGTMRVVEHGTGIDRVVDGIIEVRIRLIGSRIEKAIHKSVTESYDKTAEAALEWIDKRDLKLG